MLMLEPRDAFQIAYLAHGACGQTRADGTTPYINHPMRVAALVNLFSRLHTPKPVSEQALKDRLVCAYLHDVLEDTRLTREHLLAMGASHRQVELVELLTKESEVGKSKDEIAEAVARYYLLLSQDDDAVVVKAADRCANLEDSLDSLCETGKKLELRRWKNYVDKTYTDVLPIYKSLPDLRAEIEDRLTRIRTELPFAEARRRMYLLTLPCRPSLVNHCQVHNSYWAEPADVCSEVKANAA